MLNDDVRAVDDATIEFRASETRVANVRSIDPFSLPDPGHLEGLEFNNHDETRAIKASLPGNPGIQRGWP
jgi:hypothetical protein